MNKRLRATLYLLCTAVATFFVAGAGFSRTFSGSAETKRRQLLFPDSYEEYLPLQNPLDIAVSESYKAFADDNIIYLFDKANGVYQAYKHNVFSDEINNTVTRLQFDKAQNLYFLDANTSLYRLDKSQFSNFSTAQATDTGFVCSTFIIQEDTLFFTNVTTKTQLSKVPLATLDKQSVVLLQDDLSSKPTLAFWNGDLYYTNAGKYVHKINPDAVMPIPTSVGYFSHELVSMAVNGGSFICTDINGTFASYDLNAFANNIDANKIPALCLEEGQYSALTSFGEYVYAVQGDAITRYLIHEQTFDETYSVCTNSNKENRLRQAEETLYVDGTLYIADNGNQRISIYDTQNGNLKTPVRTDVMSKYLASDNQTLLIANEKQLVLYSLDANTYGEILFTYDVSADSLTGVAHVYGKYYCSTKNNRYFTIEYKVNEDTNQSVWAITKDTSKTYTRQTEALTTDAYGHLYTLYSTSVYRYSEEEFLANSNQTGEQIINNLPTGTKRIAVDYERNVYALTDTSVFVFKRQVNADSTETYLPAEEILCDSGDVYSQTSPTLTAFAFGIEENLTYLLYDGNYIVVSQELALPTVKNIPVNAVDKQIFSEETAEFTVLKTDKYALFIEFDLNALKDKETFPYLSYHREEAQHTVLKLGSVSGYHLVALFNTQTHRYNTYLLLQSACQALNTEDYQIVYKENEQKNGWLTNEVKLYKFPYLNPLFTASQLPRDCMVTLLGEIGGLDHEYYQVAYQQNGVTKTGFIPKTYVLPYNPLEEKSESTEIGTADSNTDAIWRFAYILLGLSAIAVLVDFLILRKRDEE